MLTLQNVDQFGHYEKQTDSRLMQFFAAINEQRPGVKKLCGWSFGPPLYGLPPEDKRENAVCDLSAALNDKPNRQFSVVGTPTAT